MKPHIWMEATLLPEYRAKLEVVADLIESSDYTAVVGTTVAVVSNRVPFDGALMDQAGPDFLAVARPGIGVDNVDIPAATERGILVINTPDGPTESTAEHAVALLMALAKRVVLANQHMYSSNFPRSGYWGTEVRDKVLGLVGLGRIGRRVAEICGQGLKMRVIAYDPYIEPAAVTVPAVELVTDLHTLLARADFVSLHTALNNETRHLIGEAELRAMKANAYLINVSRGPVIDEQALIRVLQAGHLTGVGMDVFDPEPPLADNPLLTMPNVITTPHIASYTDSGTAAMYDGIVAQIKQLLRGERPPFIVNASVWPGRVRVTG